ncbi:MFS transporter [Microvirga sp. M2]|uniref:MFS transporter n=1 Tax=Microvirga sp. M2 TaxID=3073270 RepID=UPI0039C1EC5E
MTSELDAPVSGSDALSANVASNRWSLLRWFGASATLTVPQAAGPVAFSLVALSLTGETSGGAAMILAMTLAQVAGAVPLTRLGKNLPSATVLRLLVAFRTLALASVALCTAYEASLPWLIAFAAVAGSVNGAASGYLRSVLNHFTPVSQLPRALGIAATLNEMTFVLAPVAASGLGTASPVAAVLALTALGAVPVLAVPHAGSAHITDMHPAGGSILSPAIVLWLVCAAAGSAAVAAIEIGAVALALNLGYEPAFAIIFTVPLCLASVAGGIWVSVRNRMATRKTVVVQLFVMTLGSALVALDRSIATTLVGAVLIGSVLAPLGTYYSLTLDTLSSPRRRPEVFALLRTANAVGIILASAALTMMPLSTALIMVTGLIGIVALAVAIAALRRRAHDHPG